MKRIPDTGETLYYRQNWARTGKFKGFRDPVPESPKDEQLIVDADDGEHFPYESLAKLVEEWATIEEVNSRYYMVYQLAVEAEGQEPLITTGRCEYFHPEPIYSIADIEMIEADLCTMHKAKSVLILFWRKFDAVTPPQ